jgi:hypothetical protein
MTPRYPSDECKDPKLCIAFQKETFSTTRYQMNDPCRSCNVGRARMDYATKDDRPSGFGEFCIRCAGPVGHDTVTGVCLECVHRGGTNKGNRSKRTGIKAYWGYREKQDKIIKKRAREKAA